MSNSKEQLFSDDYVKGFLNGVLPPFMGMETQWSNYKNSHPPIPEPIVEMPRSKHPIELVNEKYPNGWYSEAFEELFEDIAIARPELEWGCEGFLGWDFIKEKLNRGYNGCGNKYEKLDANATKITKEEYLSITRPNEQPQQRDYTGVKFRHKSSEEINILNKYGNDYRVEGWYYYSNEAITSCQISVLFQDGTWIEIPNEEKWQPKVGELVEIYGDNESDGVFRGEYSYTTKDGYHYIKGKDVIGCINIRPASKSIHIEQPKPEPTQRIESLEKSRKELFTNQSNIFSRLDALELQDEKYQQMLSKWDETLEGLQHLLKPQPTKKNLDIGEVSKNKEPILVTEDGVEMFDDSTWVVAFTKDNFRGIESPLYTFNLADGYIFYYSKEAASNYILLNKPCLSYNDVRKFSRMTNTFSRDDMDKFLELVKSKING